MKPTKTIWLPLIILGCFANALAQDVKHFNKDGLLYDYPSGWVLQDSSNADAQQIVMGRADSDAQVRVFVFRTPVSTPEKVAEAKKVLIDPYIKQTSKQFESMGATPQQVPASTDIANLKSEGVKIQAVLDGEPGAAEVYWGVVGERLVVLTFFGPDKARKQATSAWDTIRNSLQIEASKPAEKGKPAEKAKPQ
jgi:hypothetical protein